MQARRPASVVPFLLAAQLVAMLVPNAEYKENVRILLGRGTGEPSYRQFFLTWLFFEVAEYIGKPKSSYCVVSIGMHPSIAQMNGFFTLDGYQTNYPLH